MAVYVTSDAHGHARALDEVLSLVSPGSEDEVYVLGDMIDRGPDPLGVVRIVRSLPRAHVLMGNHEMLMLSAIARSSWANEESLDLRRFASYDYMDWSTWMFNGGFVTSDQLEQLPDEEYREFVSWAAALPAYAVAEAGGRIYVLVHAGFDPRGVASWSIEHADVSLAEPAGLEQMLAERPEEELTWVRDEFWGLPTGLVDETGEGAVVVAGHTPSIYLDRFVGRGIACATNEGQGMIVELGASELTGGVPDKIDIDCAAAGGFGIGRVGVLRLDDHQAWYASIREDE